MTLSIVLNGQTRSFDTLHNPSSLERLVQELGLKSDRVAVEHNGEIVPRSSWPEQSICEGDRLEMVHFVGGGVPTV
jgi:sulfur carrier protein